MLCINSAQVILFNAVIVFYPRSLYAEILLIKFYSLFFDITDVLLPC
jgi:hypothetical protein